MTPRTIALFIKTFSRYGGVEQFCYRFCDYLTEQGHTVTVYCGEDKSGEGRPNVQVIGMMRPGRFLKNASLYFNASRVLKKLPAGTVSMCFGNIGGCDIYRSGGPHLDFMSRSLNAQRTTAKRINKIISRLFNPINWLMPVLDQMVYPHPNTSVIIAISDKVHSAVSSQFPGVRKKLITIPNGVDTSRFSPAVFTEQRKTARLWYGVQPYHKAIGFCSTNFELKGLDRLIMALSLLPEEYVLLAVGGRNHKQYLAYAERLGVRHRVMFPGKEEEMPRFYAALDVFCHPSFFDTFGSVVAEALAMGVPTVTTKDTGASDLITDGQNGYVIDSPAPRSLSHAIWELRNHAAGQSFKVVQDDKEVFARYTRLLASIADKKGASPVPAASSEAAATSQPPDADT